MKTIPQQIESLNWSLETLDPGRNMASPQYVLFRAYQGGFKTLWRPSPEQVLSDVRKITEARKDPTNAPF